MALRGNYSRAVSLYQSEVSIQCRRVREKEKRTLPWNPDGCTTARDAWVWSPEAGSEGPSMHPKSALGLHRSDCKKLQSVPYQWHDEDSTEGNTPEYECNLPHSSAQDPHNAR